MKIAVAGLGAMGLWLAGRLLAAGHEVRCFARGATLEALQRDGLRLTYEGQESATPVFATDNPKALGSHCLQRNALYWSPWSGSALRTGAPRRRGPCSWTS